jgi:uncharacterized protein YciI
MSEMQHYLYHFLPGEHADLASNPDAWTEADNQIGVDHFNRLKQALEDGILIFAGRSLDGISPAVVVFIAANLEEAQTFLHEAPFVKHCPFRAELQAFRVALVREP